MKKNNKYPIVAKEGWLFLTISVITSIVISFFSFETAIPIWIISLFILQFFRDPVRPIPQEENLVVSAADGRIISIEKTTDPYKKRKAIKVSVFMNVFNVHSNKAPISGEIINKWYSAGKFLNASLSKSSLENERCALLIKTKNKKFVTCVQIAGLIARRIVNESHEGQELKQGERIGMIRFGSRADIYFENYKPLVKLGERVKNCESIIAEI